MKNYTITASEEQLKLIAFCIEDISRFASGQHEMNHTLLSMAGDYPCEDIFNKIRIAQQHLKKAKEVLLPELGVNESKNYNATDFIGNTYHIYKTIQYELEKAKKEYHISKPLKSGDLGIIKIEKL